MVLWREKKKTEKKEVKKCVSREYMYTEIIALLAGALREGEVFCSTVL